MSLVTFSFALVLIMATALFVSVGFNPKNESYGKIPWVYAVVCLVGSAVCRGVSHRLDLNDSRIDREESGCSC